MFFPQIRNWLIYRIPLTTLSIIFEIGTVAVLFRFRQSHRADR